MTENEIIKAWEKILKIGHAPIGESWSVGGVVTTKLAKETLDMLNCQKAEIERLEDQIGKQNKAYPCTVKMNDYCLIYARSLDDYDNLIGEISSEGIKEFAERLEYFALHEDPEINSLKCHDYDSYIAGFNQCRLQIVKGIRKIVNEVVGDDNG